MYGVVEIAGHQYRVKVGDLVDVEKLTTEAGETLSLDKVYFVGGTKALVGLPLVTGASVKVKVLKHDKGEKILMMKRKPGKYRKKRGHRQNYTALLVTEINNGQGQVEKIDSTSKNAVKYLK